MKILAEYNSLRKRFADINKSIKNFVDKNKPFIIAIIICLVCLLRWELWLSYSPILLSVIIIIYLILIVGFFIPAFKYYTPILEILSFSLIFTSFYIINPYKGKEYLNIIMFGMLFVALVPSIGRLNIISVNKRKWLFFGLILISVGFLVQSTNLFLQIDFLLAFTMSAFWFIYMNRLESMEKQKEMEQLKQAQTQAKLSSLKDQLSPHFLFNTLNTITSISQEQPVKDFVEEVANIYRYVLQYKEEDSVPLGLEIKFIYSYLFIIKSRLGEGIDFNININEEYIASMIPPLTLQMLVENAVKHNITSSDNPLNINIFMVDGSMLVIQNNYQPKISVLPTNQTGLKNIAERYRLLYKKEIIVENKNGFFTVKLPIVIA